MSEFQLKTPVAFIIFNRPDTTERVFAEIAKAKPPILLLVSDGPRANRHGEAESDPVDLFLDRAGIGIDQDADFRHLRSPGNHGRGPL